MKYCPICQQSFTDETLNFCTEDGSHLLTDEFLSTSKTLVLRSTTFPELISLRSFQNQLPSIAILPFMNLSADPENEIFCDGLAEELINSLMKLDKLHVAARTSTFSYKGSDMDVRRIGQALNVQTVLEGSVRKLGNRLRITAQLINVTDGYQLWSERYDRQLEDIFEIQEEIALAIVDALKVKLLHNEKAVLRKRYTDNVDAYQFYLKGRLWNRRTADGFKSAIGYFTKAIEIDADYAVAYSGLADYYVVLGFYEAMPPSAAGEKAKAFAKKAIDLDDTIAETHASYGASLGAYDWNWEEARRQYETAIEISPNYLAAHQYYAMNLSVAGRFDEAIKQANRCLEIDPLLPVINANLAWFYYLDRRYEEAEEQANLTIEIEPNHFSAHWIRGTALAALRRSNEAIASLQNAVTISGDRPFVMAELGRVYAQSKKKAEARKILKVFDSKAKESYISPLSRAKIHLGLGDTEEAFSWIEKAFEERSVRLPYVLLDPQFEYLHSHSRFSRLAEKMGVVLT
jgi:TolB-like protein/Tfp pilus assembly protein PilF